MWEIFTGACIDCMLESSDRNKLLEKVIESISIVLSSTHFCNYGILLLLDIQKIACRNLC